MSKKTRIMDHAEEIYNLLKTMTPMQFCITCQECALECEEHGDIMTTIAHAEELIEIIEEE